MKKRDKVSSINKFKISKPFLAGLLFLLLIIFLVLLITLNLTKEINLNSFTTGKSILRIDENWTYINDTVPFSPSITSLYSFSGWLYRQNSSPPINLSNSWFLIDNSAIYYSNTSIVTQGDWSWVDKSWQYYTNVRVQTAQGQIINLNNSWGYVTNNWINFKFNSLLEGSNFCETPEGLSCYDVSGCVVGYCDEANDQCVTDTTSCTCTLDSDCVLSGVDNPCVDYICNSGTCQTNYVNASCDDNDLCTINDMCKQGNCSGIPKDINDNDATTTDVCLPDGTIAHTLNFNPNPTFNISDLDDANDGDEDVIIPDGDNGEDIDDGDTVIPDGDNGEDIDDGQNSNLGIWIIIIIIALALVGAGVFLMLNKKKLKKDSHSNNKEDRGNLQHGNHQPPRPPSQQMRRFPMQQRPLFNQRPFMPQNKFPPKTNTIK